MRLAGYYYYRASNRARDDYGGVVEGFSATLRPLIGEIVPTGSARATQLAGPRDYPYLGVFHPLSGEQIRAGGVIVTATNETYSIGTADRVGDYIVCGLQKEYSLG